MALSDCWNSIPCLETMERDLRLWGTVLGLIGMVALLSSVVLAKRTSGLKTPRQITSQQMQSLVDKLKDGAGTKFRVNAYQPSEESQSFGGQLTQILQQAGWISQGAILYYMDAGELPPVGVVVRVDGLDPSVSPHAKRLVEILQSAGIENVHYEADPGLKEQISSSWILIQVGVKPGTR